MRISQTGRLAAAAAAALIAAGAVTPLRAADSVTIGTVGSASANLWPVFISLDKGFFAERNLKVDIIYVPSSAQVIQQLTSGSLDVTMSTGLVDPIRAIDKGSPLAIVRLEAQSPPYALVAKPSIKSMAELKGKVISVGGPKDITRIYVERMLAPHGVKPGEFDMVFAGATSARAQALLSNAVDAASSCRRSISRRSRRASTSSASPSTTPRSCRSPAPWSISTGRRRTRT
jgi:ABC-type nitrate/sulfonate/bicarbonate transport system substrate-binding protein